jgi:hypothetical protein
MVDNRGVVANDAPRDDADAPLSDDDRKRFFRPPVGDPNAGAPLPPVETPPVTRPVYVTGLGIDPQSDPLSEAPPRRKSFDEIIAGEIHRMTDAIPIIGRNRKGEPRRVIVVAGIVFAIVVVMGCIVFAVLNFLP